MNCATLELPSFINAIGNIVGDHVSQRVVRGSPFEAEAPGSLLTQTVHLLDGYAVTDWTAHALAAFSTTVDGNGAGPALVIDGDYGPLVESFTFVRGHNRDGVRIGGPIAPHLCNNTLVANAPSGGVGLFIGAGSSPVVHNSVIFLLPLLDTA